MLFRRKIRSLRRIPCPCFAGKHPLSSVAAADAAEELVSDSGVWDTKSCSREILALSNLELGLYLSCRSNSNVVAEKGVLKQKEMVSCPRWSEQDPRLARLEVCHALAKEGRLRQMRKILRQMLGDEGTSSSLLCELLCTNFKDWDSNSIVWDMLANVYARLEMMHDALFVLSKMAALDMQASISTYDRLLFNLRHTEIAWDLYEEIKSSGVSYSEYTFKILIDGLCKQGRLQHAISFFQTERGNKEFNRCIVTFNSLMAGVCNAGFVEIARSLLSLSFKYGFLPNKHSYTTLIHGLCLAGYVDEALELSEYMQTDGIELDVVIYNILINGYRLLGLMSEIWKLIRMMIQHGLQPDLVTYTILITGLCEGGNVDEGLKMRKEMLSRGFKLNIVTYSVLVNALCRKGHINEVEGLLGEMKEIGLDMDLVAYSILINGYCKLGEIEKALQVCQTMCSKIIMANSFVHGGILSSLCKNGSVPEANWYLENLAATGQTLNIILYNIVIDGYAKIGDVEGAVTLYEQIISAIHKQNDHKSLAAFQAMVVKSCLIALGIYE
ncbi:putative pentatricopeptide repeat-containing protein At1g13630 isoform X4 [Musa acuminata AAA Group]|uniref:putative pentatricopeptide repeat-containing protein At1g13630 isoform X4 n=1 Tax=Musa acuminata AAA Group TaxID=214697 RepID=UPI0031DD81F8